MTDVFYLRPIDPPATAEAALESGAQAGGCFDLHRVAWMHSFLSADGGRMLCWYRAPDAESARLALRELGADLGGVWPGRVLGDVEPGDPAVWRVQVVAELPLDGGSRHRQEESVLERMRRATGGRAEVAFAFLSNRRDRVVGLFEGGHPETVESALARDGFAAVQAWTCLVVTPPGNG